MILTRQNLEFMDDRIDTPIDCFGALISHEKC